MTIYHLHGDKHGETHLTPIDMIDYDAESGGSGSGSAKRVRVAPRFAAYDFGFAECIDPLQDTGLHVATRRQVLAVVRGQYEITTTSGESVVLQCGDLLVTDDIGTKGHWSKEVVGPEHLTMVSAGIPDDWEPPASGSHTPSEG
jgi:hypothetical protein